MDGSMQVSVKDAALLLEMPEEALWRLIRQGEVPAHRVNEEYRFNRAELFEWATAKGIKISPALFADSERADESLPTLVEALSDGGIARDLGGDDPASVLRSVVGALRLSEEIDREYLLEVMMTRESLGSTGIGDGIAIPHVRNPVVLQGVKPGVTLCFLAHPIDFNALDGKPVDTMFAIVSPTVRLHLHLLSRLGFVLRDAAFREALRARAGDEELLQALAKAESAIGPTAGAR
jgi:PTS system nitrogen regulatory IIA component